MNPEVTAYIGRSTRWPDELRRIREVLLGCDLDEQVKWGKPCYSHDGANIAILQEMNDFLSLMFFKGALLDDPAGVLESQGEHTRSALRICFRSVEDIDRLADVVRSYVAEAIAVEAAGLTVGPPPKLELVAELQSRVDRDAAFGEAFRALTPGRQREYHLYVAGARQTATRVARVDKHAARILAGKGLRDR